VDEKRLAQESNIQRLKFMDQQIEKLKGHALIFSEELRSLIQSFEMLFPMAEDHELLHKISGAKRARGFSVNRWSLIQECIIGITKLAYDAGPQNPIARIREAISIETYKPVNQVDEVEIRARLVDLLHKRFNITAASQSAVRSSRRCRISRETIQRLPAS